MIAFPQNTEVNKFVAKTKFYERAGFTEKQKSAFQAEIERITWVHKFSPDTLNIKAGKKTSEMEVFEIRLKGQDIAESTLKIIDTAIPYPILFILTAQGGLQKAVIAYKETEKDKTKIEKYFATEWLPTLELVIKGNNADQIYENFLRQITPDLCAGDDSADIDTDLLVRYKDIENIKKQIAALTAKINREPQENKRHELARERAALQLKIRTKN